MRDSTYKSSSEASSLHQHDEHSHIKRHEEVEEPIIVEKENDSASDVAARPDLSRQVSQAPSEYPGPKQVLLVMTAILLSVFLVALDRTIIATAIPSITDEFHSLDDIGWYASSFMLTSCCFQLLFGRIYTFYSPKYVFLTGIGIFEIGSAICGAAPNSIAFIIGRAIAGIGSAAVMAGAIILMVSVVPLEKRPVYQAFFGAVFGVSSVIGPLLGGAFTTEVTWRWCFYINLPIGAASMVAIMFLLKPTGATNAGLSIRQQLGQLDLLGELFLFPSIICLLLALQWGGSQYAFNSWRIILLFTLFAVLLVAFAAVQIWNRNTEKTTLPLRILKNRSVLASMWFTLCLAGTMLSLVYYISIWFQAIKGTTAVQAGINSIPMVLSLVLGSIAAGILVGRIGYYTPMMYASAVIMPIGAGLIYTFHLDTSTGQWIGYQILVGFGVGVGMQQGSIAAQTVLQKKDVAMGVTLIMFTQQFGGAIFVSVGQNVFTNALVQGILDLNIPGITPDLIVSTGATNLRGIATGETFQEVLGAYNHALQQVFLVATVLACLACFGAVALEWKSVKKGAKKGSGGQGEKGARSSTESREPAGERV
jgi:MFS family permease